MTTANPPAPSAPTAQILFFSRLHTVQPLQSRQRAGRISTWPFRVGREQGHGEIDAKDDVHVQAARVIRTTAEHWWPSES